MKQGVVKRKLARFLPNTLLETSAYTLFIKHELVTAGACSRPGCRLISTHDDYSMVQKLPDGKASVITNLREPVARVLSSYEFSVEVAARFLRHYKTRQTSTESALKDTFPFTHKTRTTRTGLMSTLDIWPWKYLVPFFQKDVFARVSSTLFFTGMALNTIWILEHEGV